MRRCRRLVWVLSAAAALGGAACTGTDAREERLGELRSQRRERLMQFLAAQNAIRDVQSRAIDEQGVRAAQREFYDALRASVRRNDPDAVALLERATGVGHDLERLAAPVLIAPGDSVSPTPSAEERRQAAEALADVERRLRPVIDRAFEDPEVATRFGVLRDSVVTAMLRLEPDAQRSLDLMRDLEHQIAGIDAEIHELTE